MEFLNFSCGLLALAIQQASHKTTECVLLQGRLALGHTKTGRDNAKFYLFE